MWVGKSHQVLLRKILHQSEDIRSISNHYPVVWVISLNLLLQRCLISVIISDLRKSITHLWHHLAIIYRSGHRKRHRSWHLRGSASPSSRSRSRFRRCLSAQNCLSCFSRPSLNVSIKSFLSVLSL